MPALRDDDQWRYRKWASGTGNRCVPDLDGAPDPLPWTLASVSTDDRVFWEGDRRVVVGLAVLAPLAIATWSE